MSDGMLQVFEEMHRLKNENLQLRSAMESAVSEMLFDSQRTHREGP